MEITKTIFFYYYLLFFMSIPLITCLFVECLINIINLFFNINISQIQKINIIMFITFYVYLQLYVILIFNNYLIKNI